MSEDLASVAVSRAQRLAAAGRLEEGYVLLSHLAEADDAAAAAELAQWRMTGDYIRRDLSLARDLFGRAGQLGRDDAEAAFIALLANGAGGSGRQWQNALARLRDFGKRDALAARQAAILDQMKLTSEGDPVAPLRRERISHAPQAWRLPEFLTIDECEYLATVALPRLTPSVVVHPGTGAFIQDPIRTSFAAAFPFTSEDPVLHAINRRIAAATETSYEQGEPLQVLSYSPGQEYKPHSDALPSGANQRVMTLLVYLNNNYKGGETHFVETGLAFRGAPGDALLFRNVDEAGRPDPLARHAGLSVLTGVKLILSKWIRTRALDLAGPPGRPF